MLVDTQFCGKGVNGAEEEEGEENSSPHYCSVRLSTGEASKGFKKTLLVKRPSVYFPVVYKEEEGSFGRLVNAGSPINNGCV